MGEDMSEPRPVNITGSSNYSPSAHLGALSKCLLRHRSRYTAQRAPRCVMLHALLPLGLYNYSVNLLGAQGSLHHSCTVYPKAGKNRPPAAATGSTCTHEALKNLETSA